MDLRTEILREHSKAQGLRIAEWIGTDAHRFQQLLHLFLQDEYRVVQRAARIISIIAEQQPAMIAPQLDRLVALMEDAQLPVAVKRNVVRILQWQSIPERLHGAVMNACVRFLEDPNETVAVRAFSMTVLARLARQYPDIRQELRAVIEAGLEQQPSPAFKSRAQQILSGL